MSFCSGVRNKSHLCYADLSIRSFSPAVTSTLKGAANSTASTCPACAFTEMGVAADDRSGNDPRRHDRHHTRVITKIQPDGTRQHGRRADKVFCVIGADEIEGKKAPAEGREWGILGKKERREKEEVEEGREGEPTAAVRLEH